MNRIVVSVKNDLVTDQRVKKVCQVLIDEGFDILLIGYRSNSSLTIDRPYPTYRMRLLFHKNFLFFAEFNLRLFFKLLFTRKKDILLANDLDTLLPNYLIAKLFRKKLVYDSHELFTEFPELVQRPKIQKVWLTLEEYIFPQLKNVITVNDIIADIYTKKYNVPIEIIRNISPRMTLKPIEKQWENNLKQGRKLLILQGAGINKDRGAEEAIAMMEHLENYLLLIIGGGIVFDDLKKIIIEKSLQNKVLMMDRLPYEELLKFTQIADLGLSLDKGTNLNYEYSLPNKVFDYIQCQIPLMVSNRKIVAELVETNQIGVVFTSYDPKIMAETVINALEKTERYATWKKNLITASEIYNWENESLKLKAFYRTIE